MSEQLPLARQRAADLGRTADLREGDAKRLPIADAWFDTVDCALSLGTIPDSAAAIGEMRRVLARFGVVIQQRQADEGFVVAFAGSLGGELTGCRRAIGVPAPSLFIEDPSAKGRGGGRVRNG